MFSANPLIVNRQTVPQRRVSHITNVASKKCNKETDVLIVGSGPVGATFARNILANTNDCKVIMVDVGKQTSNTPGEHMKNAYIYQRSENQFVDVVKGNLVKTSVPAASSLASIFDPVSIRVLSRRENVTGFVRDGINPEQKTYNNLGACAATYCVGGMGTHWGCSSPRLHELEIENIEKDNSGLLSDHEWNDLYDRAEELLRVNKRSFYESVRRRLILDVLVDVYKGLGACDMPQDLPLAVERINNRFVEWTASNTIFGKKLKDWMLSERLEILGEHMCEALDHDCGEVKMAHIKNLIHNNSLKIKAKYYVICSGSINTPQLLWKSNIKPEALGKYLTEQPLAFCQVVLKDGILSKIAPGKSFGSGPLEKTLDKLVDEQRKRYMLSSTADPVPIPTHDMDPNIWIPVSRSRPWHCQIHRGGAFPYGGVPLDVDTRLIVDLRWFGMCKPKKDNCVTFSDAVCDVKGMPQATFHYELTEDDASRQHDMMKDMLRAAVALGGFLPGSEPKFREPGESLHVEGTTRMGKDKNSSVVDTRSMVWEYSNLFIGGNGVIPYGNACNPTLTSVALALKSSDYLVGQLKINKQRLGST